MQMRTLSLKDGEMVSMKSFNSDCFSCVLCVFLMYRSTVLRRDPGKAKFCMAVFETSILRYRAVALRDSSSAYTENRDSSTLLIIAAMIITNIAHIVSAMVEGHTSPRPNM